MQSKAERPYFINTVSGEKGDVYISPLELNQEYGLIEQPYTPVIRYGLPLCNADGDIKGIIVANIYAEKLFNFAGNNIEGEKTFLLAGEGYYSFHPGKNKEWSSKNDLGTGHNIKADYGEKAGEILSGESGSVIFQGKIVGYRPVFPYGPDGQFWVIAKETSHMRLVNNIMNFILVFIGAGIFALSSSIFIGNYIAGKVAVPLQQLTRKVVDFANGKSTEGLSVIDSDDEVGILAWEFDNMAGKVEKAQSELEKKVQERTSELREANRQLQELSAAKSDFLANMSHELRTPLNAIIGFGEIMQDELVGELNQKQHRYVENMLSSSKLLLQLINDTLDLAKIEANKMKLEPELTDVKVLVDQVIDIMLPLAGQKNLTLTNEMAAVDWLITADSGKIKQIMLNLISNAIKFTPAGGTIKITGEAYEEDVVIAVADSGIGISQEEQKHIFEVFVQGDSSFTKKYQGSGLGLPLVKKILELHGGQIWVESEKGIGSKFYIRLLRNYHNLTKGELKASG